MPSTFTTRHFTIPLPANIFSFRTSILFLSLISVATYLLYPALSHSIYLFSPLCSSYYHISLSLSHVHTICTAWIDTMKRHYPQMPVRSSTDTRYHISPWLHCFHAVFGLRYCLCETPSRLKISYLEGNFNAKVFSTFQCLVNGRVYTEILSEMGKKASVEESFNKIVLFKLCTAKGSGPGSFDKLIVQSELEVEEGRYIFNQIERYLEMVITFN